MYVPDADDFLNQGEEHGLLRSSEGIEGLLGVTFPQLPACSARTATIGIGQGTEHASRFTIRLMLTTKAVNKLWVSTLGLPR